MKSLPTLPVVFSIACVVFAQHLPAQTAATDPAVIEACERGKTDMQEHKYKEALEAFKNANKLAHDSCGECYLLTAFAYFHLRDQGHALESCDKAIATATTIEVRASAHNMKGNFLLASAGMDAKTLHTAEGEFQAAATLDPKAPVFHLNLAKALLRESKDEAAKQELQVCLECAPDEKMKDEAQKLLAKPERGREESAPDFQLTTMRGQQLSLQALAGHVVVMDFWATWCPPCRESVPELRDLTRKYPAEKLVLISVSADKDENAWREFVAKKKMDWAQYRDSDGKILEAFGIHSFPTYLVIDGDGMIKERIHGLNPQETVVHRLKAVLGQMPQLEGEARK
ncbi:MAG TPA: redoxin family protein [Candidatus Solibacter sp.]|nr:redoxin family protein [Candidatus Solibacter sp.]